MANIAQPLHVIGDLERIPVAIPGGVQGSPPPFPLLNTLWKFKINDKNPLRETNIFYTYEIPFQESLIRPCIWMFTWKIHSFEWFKQRLFCLMILRSFVNIKLLYCIMDPLKRKSPVKTFVTKDDIPVYK